MHKFRFYITTALIMLPCIFSQAQTAAPLKIGYASVGYILSNMPEIKRMESDLKAYSTQLESQSQAKIKEFETKGVEYQKIASTLSEVIRTDKEKELMNLRSSIEEFQRNGGTILTTKQQSLIDPIYKKMRKAVDDVAKENGYTYVINADPRYGSAGNIMFAPEDGNISDLILKKMG